MVLVKKGSFWDIGAGLYLMQRSGLKTMDVDGNIITPKSHQNGIIACQPEEESRIRALLAHGIDKKFTRSYIEKYITNTAKKQQYFSVPNKPYKALRYTYNYGTQRQSSSCYGR